MKALTICQPYAHLVCVTLEKRVENRSWATAYRGPLLIHAGKSRSWLDALPGEQVDATYGIAIDRMSFGAVVGVATLVDCLPIEHIRAGVHDERYPWLRAHEHTEGPWCWILTQRAAFQRPVPWRGAQGLFEIPALYSSIDEQLALITPAAAEPA